MAIGALVAAGWPSAINAQQIELAPNSVYGNGLPVPATGNAITFSQLQSYLTPYFNAAGGLTNGFLSVKAFGAKCDGVTDDSAAINAAIASLPVFAGGRVHFPACASPYIINANAITLTHSHQAVILEGDGWNSPDCSQFGSASWLTANDVRGTVLKVTGTSDGILFNAPLYNQHYIIRDMAILGPGTGTASGINFGPQTSTYDQFQNILVANFATGINMLGYGNTAFYNVSVRGNTLGIDMAGGVNGGTATQFYNIMAECNATGLNLVGTGTHIYGGLIQSNSAVGIDIAPRVGAIDEISINGIWFEANAIGTRIDTTNFGIRNLVVANSRASAAGDGIVFVGVGANVNTPTFRNLDFGSAAMTLPSIVLNAVVENSFFASFTDNSNTASCSQITGVAGVANRNICTYTVQTLPAAPRTGAQAFASNAMACTFQMTPSAGGTVFCPVVYNGSAWVAY